MCVYVCVCLYVCIYTYTHTHTHIYIRVSLLAQTVKNLPAMQETQVQSLGQEDTLEKGMATNSNNESSDLLSLIQECKIAKRLENHLICL